MQKILDTLRTLYDTRADEIEAWLALRRKEAPPFITTSVDLRHSGGRVVPVDTNLFPAGFHNLSEAARARAAQHFGMLSGKRVLLIPENHTRNQAYLENLSVLEAIVKAAGAEVKVGRLAELERKGNLMQTKDSFIPEIILMNNDMTSGAPDVLKEIQQPVYPPIHMGWWARRKSGHFAAYRALVDDFGKTFSLDPWLMAAEFHQCGKVNFKEHTGLDCLAKGIEKVLARVREKYKQYGIAEEPYVFIKADSGTYGMGIMTARDPQEMFEMNKKTRNKMQVIKEGAQVSEVIIQEGVPTADAVDGKPAEPMIYLVDGVPVGGMWRVNGERDTRTNLNAAGMEFIGMCDEREEAGVRKPIIPCNFRSFGLIAAIAALAAGREDSVSFRGAVQ